MYPGSVRTLRSATGSRLVLHSLGAEMRAPDGRDDRRQTIGARSLRLPLTPRVWPGIGTGTPVIQVISGGSIILGNIERQNSEFSYLPNGFGLQFILA